MLKTAGDRKWKATPYAGVEMCGLRKNDEGGGTVLLRLAKGARFPMHDHPGGEEVFLVHGRAVIGGATLGAGDYLWTPPHGVHDLLAEEETLLFVTSANGIRLVE